MDDAKDSLSSEYLLFVDSLDTLRSIPPSVKQEILKARQLTKQVNAIFLYDISLLPQDLHPNFLQLPSLLPLVIKIPILKPHFQSLAHTTSPLLICGAKPLFLKYQNLFLL